MIKKKGFNPQALIDYVNDPTHKNNVKLMKRYNILKERINKLEKEQFLILLKLDI